MALRDRAQIVCTECHSRKIKCDLQSSPNDMCSNCSRTNHVCIRRDGVRKRRKMGGRQALPSFYTRSPKNAEFHLEDGPAVSLLSPEDFGDAETARPCLNSTLTPISQPEGFIAHSSVLSCSAPSEAGAPKSAITTPSYLQQAILRVTEAELLPDKMLFRALVDSFNENIFHHYPVIDQRDLSEPNSSVLLSQAICLAGSLVRHDTDILTRSILLYEKVKTLISINYEKDHVQVLKTLCLMSCWSRSPPDQISVDGPWHWTGIATRLAVQMGLHQEATYARRPNAGCLRRIFWQLHNSEMLQSACWGRPSSFKPRELDVRMLKLSDFEVENMQAVIFLQGTLLCSIIGNIAEMNLDKRLIPPEESTNITTALCNWVRDLPDELRLHDSSGNRRSFHRPTSELMIKYFVAIILSQHLSRSERDKSWRMSTLSIVASSCIVTLYEEIYYREQAICLLPIHGFLCMATALPLIYYIPESTEREALRQKQIHIIRCILTKMRGRYGGSDMVLRKIENLQRNVRGSPREDQTQPYMEASIMHQLPDRAKDLFPFPESLCDDMGLLRLTPSSHNDFVINSIVPHDNEAEIPFRFDDSFPLMDFSEMNFDVLNTTVEPSM